MQTQTYLLAKLKKCYPHLSYRQISARSGIQLTRLFRLFHGAEMKLGEYERLSGLCESEGKAPDHAKFSHLAKSCLSRLAPRRLERLSLTMARQLKTQDYLS